MNGIGRQGRVLHNITLREVHAYSGGIRLSITCLSVRNAHFPNLLKSVSNTLVIHNRHDDRLLGVELELRIRGGDVKETVIPQIEKGRAVVNT